MQRHRPASDHGQPLNCLEVTLAGGA